MLRGTHLICTLELMLTDAVKCICVTLGRQALRLCSFDTFTYSLQRQNQIRPERTTARHLPRSQEIRGAAFASVDQHPFLRVLCAYLIEENRRFQMTPSFQCIQM